MNGIDQKNFSNPQWLQSNTFQAISDIAWSLEQDESVARKCLIRILEHRDLLSGYQHIIDDLIQRVGLFPYLELLNKELSTSDLINIESHIPDGLNGIVLHSMQAKVYRALMDGANVILSAPTSFGKSLLIDAAIASGRYRNTVVIVPTIALIDETRRRLSKTFGREFRIITHPTQTTSERNIFVFTQERFLEYDEEIAPNFFVIDEFYKLSPNRGDNRTFVLNHAFYKLYKSGSQFFLIGPNVNNITIGQEQLSFRYFDTNFSTVVAEVRHITSSDTKAEVLNICQALSSPTLIYCKSAPSAYKLAKYLITNGITARNPETATFSQWLKANYHPDWDLAVLLEEGLAIHHGALPRSVAYHILRKFNAGEIRFLLCTSTIIEGVNTAAKNIIIYDNKVATKKFDFFTFNNIKGRAGRMFRHFVGHVYVLNYDIQQELPFVDIPSLTQPDDAPESLLIQIEDRDLTERSIQKLRYLHTQDYLPIEIIRENMGISPEGQVKAAESITNNIDMYHRELSWNTFPTNPQRDALCQLIFETLMENRGHNDIFSASQMSFKIGKFTTLKKIEKLIQDELQNNNRVETPTEAVENVLKFLRSWAEFHFPRYLLALDNIQRYVFSTAGKIPGNYTKYAAEIKKLFMPLSATILEEYGIPYQISLKLEKQTGLGETIDDIIDRLRQCDISSLNLSDFERELVAEAIENM